MIKTRRLWFALVNFPEGVYRGVQAFHEEFVLSESIYSIGIFQNNEFSSDVNSF